MLAPADELCTLFQNSSMDPGFLAKFLERVDSFKQISDGRMISCLQYLSENSIMHTPRADPISLCDNNFLYDRVFTAAWRLSETAPVTEEWERVLCSLNFGLVPVYTGGKDPLVIAERWRTEADNCPSTNRCDIASLSFKDLIRYSLARLALAGNYQLMWPLLESDDIAFRAAAYANGYLNISPALLKLAYEKDGSSMLYWAMRNENVWRSKETRETIKQLACEKPEDLAEVYDEFLLTEDAVKRQHPDWFIKTVSLNDIQGMAETGLSNISTLLSKQQQFLETLEQRINVLIIVVIISALLCLFF